MSHKNEIGVEIYRVVRSERTARAKEIQNRHGDGVLYFIFTDDGAPFPGSIDAPGMIEAFHILVHLIERYTKPVDTVDLNLLSQIWSHSPEVSFVRVEWGLRSFKQLEARLPPVLLAEALTGQLRSPGRSVLCALFSH